MSKNIAERFWKLANETEMPMSYQKFIYEWLLIQPEMNYQEKPNSWISVDEISDWNEEKAKKLLNAIKK